MSEQEKNINREPFPFGEGLPAGQAGAGMGLLIEKLSTMFSLEKDSLPAQSELPVIREYMIKKVAELMSKDYERFINSLYRIDVNENKVSEILHLKDRTIIPEKLADLIIERQLLRLKTQMLYRDKKI
jgi:hypothetical protein